MQCLERDPDPERPVIAVFRRVGAGESIQLWLEEISTEAVMRMSIRLPTNYRLSGLTLLVSCDGWRVAIPEGPVPLDHRTVRQQVYESVPVKPLRRSDSALALASSR